MSQLCFSIQSIYIKLELYCLGITCIHYIHIEKEWKGLLIENVSIFTKQLLLTEYASIVEGYCAYITTYQRNSLTK